MSLMTITERRKRQGGEPERCDCACATWHQDTAIAAVEGNPTLVPLC